jgi:hypothetical protein
MVMMKNGGQRVVVGSFEKNALKGLASDFLLSGKLIIWKANEVISK